MSTRIRVALSENNQAVHVGPRAVMDRMGAYHGGKVPINIPAGTPQWKACVKMAKQMQAAAVLRGGPYRLKLYVWREPKNCRRSRSEFFKLLDKIGVGRAHRGRDVKVAPKAPRYRLGAKLPQGHRNVLQKAQERADMEAQAPPQQPAEVPAQGVNWGEINIPLQAQVYQGALANDGNGNRIAFYNDVGNAPAPIVPEDNEWRAIRNVIGYDRND